MIKPKLLPSILEPSYHLFYSPALHLCFLSEIHLLATYRVFTSLEFSLFFRSLCCSVIALLHRFLLPIRILIHHKSFLRPEVSHSSQLLSAINSISTYHMRGFLVLLNYRHTLFSFIAFCFIALHRCCIFYKLKTRPSPPAKR